MSHKQDRFGSERKYMPLARISSVKNGAYTAKIDRNNTSFTLQLFEYFKKAKWGTEYDFLKYYQNIVRMFVNDVDVDARGLLIYQTMGLGKSILAISIAMDLMKERQPIILLTKSLQENMRGAIRKYVSLRKTAEPDYAIGRLSDQELEHWIDHNYSFVSMNASNMLKQMGKAAEGHSVEEFDAALEKKFGEVLKLASLDGKLLIVDEAHNLFRAITNGSKNAQGLYDMVMKAKNIKVMFFTGTPIANDPFELVPCFNMLGSRSGKSILPESYKEFNRLFVDEKNGKIKNKEKFQNRLLGLVSHVSHLTEPGKALGVHDPATRAEFPEEKPIVVERVNMDSEQFVIYQLARDKEKEEGTSSRFSASSRIVEAPSMTKPKSKAASTYRVKSRQLSNFCAPPAFREEKDPANIPPEYTGSAKYRRIYENIEKHKNQLGIVYSQFVGVGGLGTFSKYLESNNWQRIDIGAKSVETKSPSDQLSNLEPAGELDEYVDMRAATSVDEKVGMGPEIPAAESYLRDLEAELVTVDNSAWWLDEEVRGAGEPIHRINKWRFGGDSSESSEEDEHDNAETLYDLEFPAYSLANSAIDFPTESLPAKVEHSIEVTFKYAGESDVESIRAINPAYEHKPENFKYPKYILLVLENGVPTGYAEIEYNIAKDGTATTCMGKMNKSYFDKISQVLSHDVIKKIIDDAIKCTEDNVGFRKTIWGGAVDPSGAAPTSRPDRARKYAIISGDVTVEDRARIQDMFNADGNKHGGAIDLILLSSTGAEGLDLKNVRHIHIMEPYWNWGRVKQIIARGVRNDSHKALPADEKNVTPYIYLAVPPETERSSTGEFIPTTDTELYDESITNQLVIESFHDALREISIECLVNGEEYCRKCNPTSAQLFTDDVTRDIKAPDPCTEVREEHITAEEIMLDDQKYYYVADPSSIYDYKIFTFDENINGYRQMPQSDPRYIKIIEAIEENKK